VADGEGSMAEGAPSSAPAEGAPSSAPADARPWPDSAFERLLGRQVSEPERTRLYQVREALGLEANDALWVVLIALQYHLSLYERFPPMIHAAARELLAGCKTETDQALAGAKQQLGDAAREQADAAALAVGQASIEARAALENAIQQAARRIALKAGLAARWPWLAGGAAAMALALLLTGALAVGFGHQQGYHRGYVEGYRAAETAVKDRSAERPPPARGR